MTDPFQAALAPRMELIWLSRACLDKLIVIYLPDEKDGAQTAKEKVCFLLPHRAIASRCF
eukprot:COSAG06_NODE_16689_length_986_cov_1.790304_3_plen_59_part_01